MPARRGRGKSRRTSPRRKASTVTLAEGHDSEVEAYGFIRDQLRELGWIVKNPTRHPDGQVWTQNQCLAHPEIRRCLGAARPENIVKLAETKLWVVEAKRERSRLAQALGEAEDDYAWPINNGGNLKVPLISGIAGNDSTGYEVRTRLLVDGEYKPVIINGREATGFLDPRTVETLVQSGNPSLADLPINEPLFLKTAERINRTLHLGGINKNERAKVMAALLLSLVEEPGPNVDSDLVVLIDDINTRTRAVLRRQGKAEFHPFVLIQPPTNSENHVKFRAAIVQTIQELNNLSIKSAMNSGADVLGKFYEVFLKYGNGAKEIGIVLTPRHITRFAVQALGVGPNDLVLDPACGTGGFLVAAFDHVRRIASAAQIERFKQFNLFGIERESYVAALAIVNMIFRGDGKNNIVEANCFSKFLKRTSVRGNPTADYVRTHPPTGEEPISRVFMNPPFALKESDEKEFRFVETALSNMADGGLLFAIVPMSVMTEAGTDGKWRRDVLLAHHTLLAVVSFPEELFYPIANQTVGLVVRKGTQHPQDQPVLWGRVVSDGFQKSKGKRLPSPDGTPNDLNRLLPLLRSFLLDPSQPIASIPEFVRAAPIDFSDPILELVPEAYLESQVPDLTGLKARLRRQVSDNVAALVETDLRLAGDGPTIIDAAHEDTPREAPRRVGRVSAFRQFQLDSLFNLYPGDYHSMGDLDPGTVPVASCADSGNGIVGTFDVPDEHIYRDALTIAFNGRPLTTKLHPYSFGAKDDVAVAIPKIALPPEVLVFIQAALNAERWRFSYYRKCFRAKLGRLTIGLPAKSDGSPNIDFMLTLVRAQRYWWFIGPRLRDWQPSTPGTAREPTPRPHVAPELEPQP